MADSLLPHGLQHARPPSPSPSPGVCSNSCPLSQWCDPTISSSVAFFSFCLRSFPASGSFPRGCLFKSGGQSIEVSASASVLPMNTQGWFPLGWAGLIFAVQGTLKSLLQHHSSKASVLWHSAFFKVQLSHLYMTAGKTIALTRWTFGGKVMSLIFFREILIPYLFMGSPYSPTMRNKTVCHQGYFKHQLFSLNHRSLSLT